MEEEVGEEKEAFVGEDDELSLRHAEFEAFRRARERCLWADGFVDFDVPRSSHEEDS